MSLFHTENRNRFWFLKLKKHRKIKRYTKILQQICTASIEKSKENTDCCNCKLLVIILSSKTDGQNNQLVLAVCILRKNNSFWSGVVLRNLSIRRKETIKLRLSDACLSGLPYIPLKTNSSLPNFPFLVQPVSFPVTPSSLFHTLEGRLLNRYNFAQG